MVAGDPQPPIALYLRSSGPGFCLHEPLDGYDRRTRRLLDWVRAVGEQHDTADGDDLVHVDFHPGNMLFSGDRLTGVVDWAIRHHGPADVDFWLATAEPGLQL